MSVVRRRGVIDALEHALQGVKAYDEHHVVSKHDEPGIIGMRSAVEVDVRDGNPEDREVVVKMPRPRRRGPSR